MAKIRSIHPELCIDETLAEVSANAERTLVRLWVHLDDDGRHLDNPRLLKAALYPLHDISVDQVNTDLEELASRGLIIRYIGSDGRRYLSAKSESWARWQKPRWRKDSTIPPPPGRDGTKVQSVGDPPSTDGEPPSTTDSDSDSAETERNDTTDNSVGQPPSDVGHTTAQVVEGEGVGVVVGVGEVATAALNSNRLSTEQRRQRIHQAVDILTERHLDVTPSRTNRHRDAVHAGKLKDHAQLGHTLLSDDPTLSAEQLADELEPGTAPLRSIDDLVTKAPKAIKPQHGPGCRDARCDGYGNLMHDDGTVTPHGCPGPLEAAS